MRRCSDEVPANVSVGFDGMEFVAVNNGTSTRLSIAFLCGWLVAAGHGLARPTG